MIIYKYLFYWIYYIWKKIPGKDHAFLAMLALTGILFINMVNGITLYERITKNKLDNVPILLLAIFIIIFSLNYYLFIHNKKYNKIENELNNKNIVSKIFGSIILIILLFFTIFFAFMMNHGYYK